MPFNNLALYNYAKQIDKMPHPKGTERVSFQKNISIYTGNGDHCDFLVLEIRTYDLKDKDEIKSFYDRVSYSSYIKTKYRHGSGEANVFFPDEGERIFEEVKEWIYKAQKLSNSPLYAISHTQYYSDGFGDIRCT